MTAKKKTKAELELEALTNIKRQGKSNPKATEKIKELEKKFNVVFSPIEKVNPSTLEDNPLNDYIPLSNDELKEMANDMKSKGVVVPLIAKLDNVLICGHNRKKASLLAGLKEVPVLYLKEPMNPTDELIKDLMKSENNLRRGGKWSKEKKQEFIENNFLEVILKTSQGGNNKDKENLAKKIEEMTKGKIGESTAKQIIALIKKKHSGKSKVKITLKGETPQNQSREFSEPPPTPSKAEIIKSLKIEKKSLESRLREIKEELKKLESKK